MSGISKRYHHGQYFRIDPYKLNAKEICDSTKAQSNEQCMQEISLRAMFSDGLMTYFSKYA